MGWKKPLLNPSCRLSSKALLREPGGFEGLLGVEVEPTVGCLAVPE